MWSFRLVDSQITGSALVIFANVNTVAHVPSHLTPQNVVFDKHRVMSNNHDIIGLELSVNSLGRALKACVNASKVVITLSERPVDQKTVRQSVFLSFKIVQSGSATLHQDVPVSVLSPRRILETEEPELPSPSIKVEMSDLRIVKGVVDKLKTVCWIVCIV